MRYIVSSIRNMILNRYFANKGFIYPLLNKGVVILILLTGVENADIIAAGFSINHTGQYECYSINKNVQINSLDCVVFSDTLKNKDLAVDKSSDDELGRAIDEQSKMRNEHSGNNSSDKYWQEDFNSIFDNIEFPDTAAWNRAHENIKEAMNHFRSESKGFKEEFNKAKLEMNKAVKRMQKQYREFNDEELNDLKKEIQKAIDDLKTPDKPRQHKPDTIRISPM
ncbi:MAG: hypothetical protein J7L04_06025 [Bacteroidales bacterium]|nr:hypothetical protein [Bacteroidales bacterium]